MLCLGALTACLALALNIGNATQQETNAQDAADSAALAAAGEVGPNLGSVPQVPVCDVHGYCPCPRHLDRGCHGNYAWLDFYYIFVPQEGWLEIVPASNVGPGQISDQQAFWEGLDAGWSCAPQPRWLGHRCFFVNTNITGWSPGALAGGAEAVRVALAAQYAEGLAATFYPQGQSLYWSGCASPPSHDFALAISGQTCIAYEANTGTIVFWVRVLAPAGPSWVLNDGVAQVEAEAFATWVGGPGGHPALCSPNAGSCS
jgi:hypothetical protein